MKKPQPLNFSEQEFLGRKEFDIFIKPSDAWVTTREQREKIANLKTKKLRQKKEEIFLRMVMEINYLDDLIEVKIEVEGLR